MSSKNGVIKYDGTNANFTIPASDPIASGKGVGIGYSGENVRVTIAGDFLPSTMRITVEENMGIGGWVPHIDGDANDAVFSEIGGKVLQLPAGNQIRLSIVGADSTTSSGSNSLFYRITDTA